jgi:hypothetical protein
MKVYFCVTIGIPDLCAALEPILCAKGSVISGLIGDAFLLSLKNLTRSKTVGDCSSLVELIME